MLVNIGIVNALLIILILPSIAFGVFQTLESPFNKYKESSILSNIEVYKYLISGVISIILTIILYSNLTTIYIIRSETYNTYYVFGSLDYKFKDNSEVNIKQNSEYILINDSEKKLTLESVDYLKSYTYYNIPTGYNHFIYSFSYLAIPRKIDYLFTEPPKTKTSQSSSKIINFWLHY